MSRPEPPVQPNIYQVVSQMNRAATLRGHTNAAIDLARSVLDGTEQGARRALTVLQEAAPEFVRLGGLEAPPPRRDARHRQ